MADPQFGFRVVARVPSPNLETVHAGAASCRRLDLDIPYAAATTSFVLSCQSGSGGFARTSDTLPDMTPHLYGTDHTDPGPAGEVDCRRSSSARRHTGVIHGPGFSLAAR